eukprot:m.1596927 g.1596927  ORF g.1596927 m.1596927 type:complete len:136 (+) comp25343_c2_seq8:6154-6561(+)
MRMTTGIFEYYREPVLIKVVVTMVLFTTTQLRNMWQNPRIEKTRAVQSFSDCAKHATWHAISVCPPPPSVKCGATLRALCESHRNPRCSVTKSFAKGIRVAAVSVVVVTKLSTSGLGSHKEHSRLQFMYMYLYWG